MSTVGSPCDMTRCTGSAVFPLGMYTACTLRVTEVIGADFLMVIPRTFYYIALGAWLLTFAGLLHRVSDVLRITTKRQVEESSIRKTASLE